MSLKEEMNSCGSVTRVKLFGLCDDPPPSITPAYIDEIDGSKWIAIVDNEPRLDITFIAIDNCINFKDQNGNLLKRCDGVLIHDETIIFVELKNRNPKNNEWVKDGEEQLRSSITQFARYDLLDSFKRKKAYIANNQHPKFKSSQISRMSRFNKETGFILRVENRIIL